MGQELSREDRRAADLFIKSVVVKNADTLLNDGGDFTLGLSQVRLQTLTKHWTCCSILCHTSIYLFIY